MYRIKEICRNKGLMLKDLAEKIGITEVGLSKSLNGNPTISRLQDISKALDVDFIELFVPIDNVTKGYIEHKGKIYKINSISDIERMLEEIKEKNK
ncbi:XRE family transcriptional regulator [Apibacter muscae]|uniref:helix-turn-helix domain-containing protein n=1 Tax=Apibacter muscae TaxID=2509004 RepID=UPI0011ABA0EE|nr:helix-turn-helix transcriptional regulator [Apibacter muscae]TWP29350.1 XRE family transcriptional regulator [Apibacter muscae]